MSIKVISETTNKAQSLILNDNECPDDGAYKVLGTGDDDQPKNILIVGEFITFSDGFSLTETVQYENLEHTYILERCTATLTFTN